MPGKFEAPKGSRPSRSGSGYRPRYAGGKGSDPLLPVYISTLVGVVLLLVILLFPKGGSPEDMPPTLPVVDVVETQPETTVPETTMPEPEHVVSTATVNAMGDLLMHLPIIRGASKDGGYDFNSIFRFMERYISAADISAANLETTLCGTSKPYSGFPQFNCPDEIVDAAANAGFDMLLTANNHCYDTSIDGYRRTLEVVRSKGLDTLGTMLSEEEPKFIIRDVNGIKLGMICYTYETSNGQNAYPSLNGLPMYDGSFDIINTFRHSDPEPFLAEMEQRLAEMKEAGAEATILFIHWGVEYLTYANDSQKYLAQALCDLGVDVIIGGHPHVIEPVALLDSTVDAGHKTVCIYSLGNALSNQRYHNISMCPSGHTEDGALFSVTFEKYSDGTVYLAGMDLLPTWVKRYENGTNGYGYELIPLHEDQRDRWQELYELSDANLTAAGKSWDRTQAIVGEGVTQCQEYLAQEKEAREQYYYDLVFHPEKLETVPLETEPAETEPVETSQDAA